MLGAVSASSGGVVPRLFHGLGRSERGASGETKRTDDPRRRLLDSDAVLRQRVIPRCPLTLRRVAPCPGGARWRGLWNVVGATTLDGRVGPARGFLTLQVSSAI